MLRLGLSVLLYSELANAKPQVRHFVLDLGFTMLDFRATPAMYSAKASMNSDTTVSRTTSATKTIKSSRMASVYLTQGLQIPAKVS